MMGLWDLYGVRQIFGVTAGYRGFYSREPIELNPKLVHDWHKRGGTVLETSRGGFDLDKIVDAIKKSWFQSGLFYVSLDYASRVCDSIQIYSVCLL